MALLIAQQPCVLHSGIGLLLVAGAGSVIRLPVLEVRRAYLLFADWNAILISEFKNQLRINYTVKRTAKINVEDIDIDTTKEIYSPIVSAF